MLIKGELRYIQILRDRGTCIDSRLDEIEEALKCGEKYEQIVKEIKYEIDWHRPEREVYDAGGKGDDEYINETLDLIDKIEQKYFPRPVKKTITIEIEGENKDVSKFADRLSRVVGQINFGVRTNIKEETKWN